MNDNLPISEALVLPSFRDQTDKVLAENRDVIETNLREVWNNILKADETDDKYEAIARELLWSGTYNGMRIDSIYTDLGTHGPYYQRLFSEYAALAIKKRVILGYLALSDSATFQAIVDNDVVAFHGTLTRALPFILKTEGLMSHSLLSTLSQPVGTGELHPGNFRRRFVSFSEIGINDALDMYSTRPLDGQFLYSKGDEYPGVKLRKDELAKFEQSVEQLPEHDRHFLERVGPKNSSMALGLALRPSIDTIKPPVNVHTNSDLKELSFADSVGLEYLPIVAVKGVDVNETQAYLDKKELTVPITAVSYDQLAYAQLFGQQSTRQLMQEHRVSSDI